MGTPDLERFGVPIETALDRRERLANQYDYEYGHERVFPELLDALLEEVPEGSRVLEVGAATGLITPRLLERAGSLTALEPSPGMLKRLLSKDAAEAPNFNVIQGMAEDLLHDVHYDAAVVTFTPRRGTGLLRLLNVLALHVDDRVVMLLDEDSSMEWAFLARAAAAQGFETRLRIVNEAGPASTGAELKRAIILVAGVADWNPQLGGEQAWELEARVVDVPSPAPWGAATRLVRYFLSGTDRAILVKTDKDGVDRLYGNLRTAVHRLARDEVTVRRSDDGVQLVRLPKVGE
jgi:precorrin-6B methylase 2